MNDGEISLLIIKRTIMKKDNPSLAAGQESEKKKQKTSLPDHSAQSPQKEERADAEEETGFQHTLNSDLQELLDKDKRRFFGGCGG